MHLLCSWFNGEEGVASFAQQLTEAAATLAKAQVAEPVVEAPQEQKSGSSEVVREGGANGGERLLIDLTTTPTATPSASVTGTSSSSQTGSASASATATQSAQATATETSTSVITRTSTKSSTATASATLPPGSTASATATGTATSRVILNTVVATNVTFQGLTVEAAEDLAVALSLRQALACSVGVPVKITFLFAIVDLDTRVTTFYSSLPNIGAINDPNVPENCFIPTARRLELQEEYKALKERTAAARRAQEEDAAADVEAWSAAGEGRQLGALKDKTFVTGYFDLTVPFGGSVKSSDVEAKLTQYINDEPAVFQAFLVTAGFYNAVNNADPTVDIGALNPAVTEFNVLPSQFPTATPSSTSIATSTASGTATGTNTRTHQVSSSATATRTTVSSRSPTRSAIPTRSKTKTRANGPPPSHTPLRSKTGTHTRTKTKANNGNHYGWGNGNNKGGNSGGNNGGYDDDNRGWSGGGDWNGGFRDFSRGECQACFHHSRNVIF